MDELLILLKDAVEDVDFENCTALIDDGILSSFDIIQIISVIEDEYDITVPIREIIPDNFNSLKAIYDLIGRLKA